MLLLRFSGAALLIGAISAQGADFAHDVAPIIYKSCTPCHHAGGAGPFPLTSYADVKERAAQMPR